MNKSNKLIIVMIIVIVGLVAYIIYNNYIKKDNKGPEEYRGYEELEHVTKTYAINEYHKLSIDDNQMAIIYFTDYQQYLVNNRNKAYEYVDPEYAEIKCRDISEFNFNVGDKFKTTSVKKYDIINKGDYSYYVIQDTEDNMIVFKTNGVMNYTVYLDDETVVIQ